MGYGQLVILLEGDHTSDVNRILEMFDSYDVEDLLEGESFTHAHRILNSKYITRMHRYQPDRMSQYYYIVGFHKGWTVVEEQLPTRCDKDTCLRVSSLINGKVVSLGIETHASYYEVVLCDKGRATMHVKIDDCRIVVNEGLPYTPETTDGLPSFGDGDVYRIAEGITGIDVDDLIGLHRKEKILKVSVKSAFKKVKSTRESVNKKLVDALESLKPGSAEAYYYVGAEYEKIFYNYDASKAYITAIRLAPDHFEACHHLGIVYGRMNLLKKAVPAFTSAIGIIEKYLGAGHSSVMTIRQGPPGDGSKIYRQQVELIPCLARVHFDMGMAYFRDCSWDEAIRAFNKAVELKPDDERAYGYLGTSYRSLKAYPDAVRVLKKAIVLDPDNAGLYHAAGDALYKLGSFDEAILMLTKAVRLKPDMTETYLVLGNSYLNKGAFDDAMDACWKAIRLNGHVAEAYCCLGKARYGAGAYGTAIDAFSTAIQLKSNYGEAYQCLGLAYDAMGSFEDAAQAFQKAIEVSPDGSTAYNELPVKYKSRVRLI